MFQLRFLIDFGPNLVPTWPPNPAQNPPKSHQKSISNRILFLICFLIDFLSIFYRFSTPKSTKNPSKINPKINPRAQLPKYQKSIKNVQTLYDFSHFGHAMLEQKINKNQSKIHHKTDLKSTPQLASILGPTWLHFWRGLGAKMGPNRFKNRSSNPSKN